MVVFYKFFLRCGYLVLLCISLSFDLFWSESCCAFDDVDIAGVTDQRGAFLSVSSALYKARFNFMLPSKKYFKRLPKKINK
jgi:hypothetical protein